METLFDKQTESAAETYDRENPEIWQEFKRIALKLIGKGVGRYSAKAIFEVIRYDKTIETGVEGFKLNNNFTAYYARKFIETFPFHAGFFELRERKND